MYVSVCVRVSANRARTYIYVRTNPRWLLLVLRSTRRIPGVLFTFSHLLHSTLQPLLLAVSHLDNAQWNNYISGKWIRTHACKPGWVQASMRTLACLARAGSLLVAVARALNSWLPVRQKPTAVYLLATSVSCLTCQLFLFRLHNEIVFQFMCIHGLDGECT